MTINQETTLPLSGLRIDPANVRKAELAASPAFIANIKERGVTYPLIVRPNGVGHLVTDGGKRLAALQALAKAGDIPADHPVRVIINDVNAASARETSLALNVIREEMHPVDVFRAFAAIHRDKSQPLDVDAIAAHFGVPRKQVERSLALGSLADPILDAWRNGDLDDDAAQAFTLCPSKKAQLHIFERLSKGSNVSRHAIKHALKIAGENVGRKLGIVGVAAYEKAGGKATVDLFGTDHVISDAALLDTLVAAKIKETCDALIASGWSWAASELPADQHQYGQLEGKPATKEHRQRLSDLGDQIDELMDEDSPEAIKLQSEYETIEDAIARDAYSPGQKARGGCFVGLNFRQDAIEISYGRVKPVEKPSKADKIAVPGQKQKKPKVQTALSQALRDRLRKQKLKATRSALLADKHASPLAARLASIVAQQIEPDRPYGLPSVIANGLDAIRDGITPKVMDEHQRKAFDRADYFGQVPKAFNLRAITEAINADEARKLSGKKKVEIARFALANVGKTAWLPTELRTSHYKKSATKKRK
jgi:ParB family chromosome partitioning protein